MAQLGYCGLDRQRNPLRGDEIRPCWEARPPARLTPIEVTPRADTPGSTVASPFWGDSEL
ncbi:MAG TPA: hypothetical protein VNF73_10450 [Candidatus Saccharimonadales bacterium]|nr:hypothetical protein [Candidatus Saccharimonadales bacterium]